jgi:hypothetical protein
MPLWNRFPNLTRVTRLRKHLVTFLQHWEMMIPQPGRDQVRQGIQALADHTPVGGFLNTSFVAGKHWTGKPWDPIWQTHQDEFLSALLYGAVFLDVMIHHPFNWVAWRPDESDFGIVRERRDCSCYGDHRLGEVTGLTYMRVETPPSEPQRLAGVEDLAAAFRDRRVR